VTARLLNVSEAAEILDLGVSTLNKMRSAGGGPDYIKMGAAVRYEIEALDRYKAKHRIKSTAQGKAA
jgi:predicted DNA-binding transcriptional regulator AlpA